MINGLNTDDIEFAMEQLEGAFNFFMEFMLDTLIDERFNQEMADSQNYCILNNKLFSDFKWVLARLPKYDDYSPGNFKRGFNLITLWYDRNTDTQFSEEYLLQRDIQQNQLLYHVKAIRCIWQDSGESINHHTLFENDGRPNRVYCPSEM